MVDTKVLKPNNFNNLDIVKKVNSEYRSLNIRGTTNDLFWIY